MVGKGTLLVRDRRELFNVECVPIWEEVSERSSRRCLIILRRYKYVENIDGGAKNR